MLLLDMLILPQSLYSRECFILYVKLCEETKAYLKDLNVALDATKYYQKQILVNAFLIKMVYRTNVKNAEL